MEMLQVVAQALGTLSWDLPARVNYTPGTSLPFTLVVGNPTSGARSYGLQAQVLIGGQVAWSGDLLVDGQRWFQVAAGGQLSMQGSFQADRSDLLLKVLLIDQATNQVVAQVQSELVSPTAAPTPPTDILGLVLVMGLMGAVVPMLRPKEE